MSLKNWILHGVHRMNGLAARGDLPGPRADVDASSTPPTSAAAPSPRAERGKRSARASRPWRAPSTSAPTRR